MRLGPRWARARALHAGRGRADSAGDCKTPGRSLARPRGAPRSSPGPPYAGGTPVCARAREVPECDLGLAEGSPPCCVSVSAGCRRRWPGTQTPACRPGRVSPGAAATRDPSAALARRAGGDRLALHLTRVMGNGRVTLSTSERGFRCQVRAELCPAWDQTESAAGAEPLRSLEEGAALPCGTNRCRAQIHPLKPQDIRGRPGKEQPITK